MILNIPNIGFERKRRNVVLNEKIIVSLGEGSYVDGVEVNIGDDRCLVTVGKYTSIGRCVDFIIGLNHDYRKMSVYPFTTIKKIARGIGDVNPGDGEGNKKEIIIGSDVWIGAGCTIVGGVHIGDGAVIGAGAVVAKNIPPYAIAVGNPVKIIKYRFDNKVINKLEKFKWWNKGNEWIEANIELLEQNIINDIEEYTEPNYSINEFEVLKNDGYRILYMIPDVDNENEIWKKYINFYKNKYSRKDKIVLVVANRLPNIEDDWVKYLLDGMSDSDPIITCYEFSEQNRIAQYIDLYILLKDMNSIEMLDYINNETQVFYCYESEVVQNNIFRGMLPIRVCK